MALTVSGLDGNEIYGGEYYNIPSEVGRWGYTWEVFKKNFGKIVLNNILMLLFFIPAIAVLLVRAVYVSGLGYSHPFNANTGLGYPAYPGTQGLNESIYFTADLLFYGALAVASLIASIGIAGGAYSMKKLLTTNGKFTVKGFFHGVKVCYFNVAAPVAVFACAYFVCVIAGDWKNLDAAHGVSIAGAMTAYVFAIIGTVIIGLYGIWAMALGVGYKLKAGQLLKNSFILMVGSIIQTAFFAGLALMPVWLLMIGFSVTFIQVISYMIMIFFGFSYMLLVWMSYTQWVLDTFITPNRNPKKAEEDKPKKTAQEVQVEREKEAKRIAGELLAAGKSELICKPILPIEKGTAIPPISTTFSRDDLSAVEKSREKLGASISAYENQHKNDPEFKEYNAMFADREKALQEDDKKSKKKKISADNLLK